MSRSWADARRILAIRLDGVGDLLMTEPALAALNDGGRRRVTLLTSPAATAVAPILPSVDEVISYSAPWMKATPLADATADLALVERLRADAYDAAAIFAVATQSPLPAALVAHLAGIGLRAAHCRENPYHLLTDWLREPEAPFDRHEVERQLDLVRGLGFVPRRDRIEVRIGAGVRAVAREKLSRSGLDPARPWAVLHPGASAPSRRYPADRFGMAAGALVREDGLQMVVVGGPDEGGLVADVRGTMGAPSIGVVGELSLPELGAVIEGATLFIGNNSGPMHLAAAVGTPSVVLYAQTNPQHTPWRVPAVVLSRDVPCRNCLRSECPLGHHACLRLIGPDEIVAAARSLASGVPGRLSASPA